MTSGVVVVTRVMLPTDLDGTTVSKVTVGTQDIYPRRDPELEVAWRVFDDWMPKETS